MNDHVTPFLKRTNSFVSNCSLRDRLRDLVKNASKNFLFFKYSGALVTTFHYNWWSAKYFNCLAGSVFGSSYSAHLKTITKKITI